MCCVPTVNETQHEEEDDVAEKVEEEEDCGAHLENRRKKIKNAKILYITDHIFNRNVVVEAL